MYEVLAYVYQNYWRGDACPQSGALSRKLSAQGFDADEIRDALQWLDGLALATHGIAIDACAKPAAAAMAPLLASSDAMRVFSSAEQDHLGADGLGFIRFLESAGVLTPALREVVMERAMAAPGDPVALDELKIIVLMVHWRTGIEPDALVQGELSAGREDRIAH